MKIHRGVPRSLVCFPACVLELTKKFTKKEKKKSRSQVSAVNAKMYSVALGKNGQMRHGEPIGTALMLGKGTCGERAPESTAPTQTHARHSQDLLSEPVETDKKRKPDLNILNCLPPLPRVSAYAGVVRW